MAETNEGINCVDIAMNVVHELSPKQLSKFQIVGGVGSAALAHPDTKISVADKMIYAPSDLWVPQFRDDGNKRDFDCLVLSTLPQNIKEVDSVVKSTVGNSLKASVFGVQTYSSLHWQRVIIPYGMLKKRVNDRHGVDDDNGLHTAVKASYLFDAPLPKETLETYGLKVGQSDAILPVPHPGTTILNYLGRSSSGLRPKDVKKAHKITANVAAQVPEIIEWIKDGPGASQFEQARIQHTLREPTVGARAINLGGVLELKPYDIESLRQREDLAIPVGPDLLPILVDIEHLVCQSLFAIEKRPRTVKYWQKYVEPRIDFVLGTS